MAEHKCVRCITLKHAWNREEFLDKIDAFAKAINALGFNVIHTGSETELHGFVTAADSGEIIVHFYENTDETAKGAKPFKKKSILPTKAQIQTVLEGV